MAAENEDIISLLDVNHLMYVPSTDASPSINRVIRKQYPEKNIYVPESVMVFNLHGAHFADMSQSYLSFDLEANANINFDTGSVLNLFKEVRVIAPNGKEISRTFKNNLLQRYLMYVKHSTEWEAINKEFLTFATTTPGATSKYSVPLRLIEYFFETTQLLPPRLVEGLRVEITLERPNVALIDSSSYTIRNPEFSIDSYELNNQVNIILAQMPRMVYEYKRWFHTTYTMPSSANTANITCNHSVSSALEAVVIPRSFDQTIATASDSFKSNFLLSDTSTQLWRWGSVRMPQNELDSNKQWFANLLYTQNKMNSHSMKDFNLNFGSYINEFGTANVNLRRSNVLENSGREISNAALLQCDLRFGGALINRVLDMFVLSLARIVLDGDVVSVEQ